MLLMILPLALALGPQQSPRVEYVISQLLGTGFSPQEAEALFSDPRLEAYPPRVIQPRKIDWDQIIAGLVAPASVRRGKEFLAEHGETLRRAEETYGVAKEVIAAVVRLESNFGQNSGRYVVFNAFYTFLIQSEEERRWKWAAENLVALAGYCKASGDDCFALRGSYAGALGPAQFLPASVEKFGRDGNGDGRINPFEFDDALFSAANFLIEHGWREDKVQALGRYYGSSNGYPRAILAYAEALGPAQP
jgi:membrane-bound lytic murein transglycosylase B